MLRQFETQLSPTRPRQFENKPNPTMPRQFENKPNPTMPRQFENKPSPTMPRQFENKPSPTMPRQFEKQPGTKSAICVLSTKKPNQNKPIPADQKPSSAKQADNKSQNTLYLQRIRSPHNKSLPSAGKEIISGKPSAHHSGRSEQKTRQSTPCEHVKQQKQFGTHQSTNQKQMVCNLIFYQATTNIRQTENRMRSPTNAAVGHTQRSKCSGSRHLTEGRQVEKSRKLPQRQRSVCSDLLCSPNTNRLVQLKEPVEVGHALACGQAVSPGYIKPQTDKNLQHQVSMSGSGPTRMSNLPRSQLLTSSPQCPRSQNTLITRKQETPTTRVHIAKENKLPIAGEKESPTRAHSAQTPKAEPPMLTEESQNQDVCKGPDCSRDVEVHCVCLKTKPLVQEHLSDGQASTEIKSSITQDPNEQNPVHTRVCVSAPSAYDHSTTQPRYTNYLKRKFGFAYNAKPDKIVISKPCNKDCAKEEQPEMSKCSSPQNFNDEKCRETAQNERENGFSTQEPSSNIPSASNENVTAQPETTNDESTNAAENHLCEQESLKAGETSSDKRVMHSTMDSSVGVTQKDQTFLDTGQPGGACHSVSSLPPHEDVPVANTKNIDNEAVTTCRPSSPVIPTPSYTVDSHTEEELTTAQNCPGQEETKHDHKPGTTCKMSSDENTCEASTKSTTSVEKETHTLKSVSEILGNFHLMLQKWKKELLVMQASLDASALETACDLCTLCRKEHDATTAAQGYHSVQELRQVILQLKQSPEHCHACNLQTGASKESAADSGREQQPCRKPQRLNTGYCSESLQLTAPPVLQSLHFLLHDFNLLLELLDTLEYESREVCGTIEKSPHKDATNDQVKGKSMHKNLPSLQQALRNGNQGNRNTEHLSDDNNKVSQDERKSPSGIPHSKSLSFLRNSFANGRHMNGKASPETASISKTRQDEEKIQQGHISEISAHKSENCPSNTCTLCDKESGERTDKRASGMNRKPEHNQGAAEGHAGQINKTCFPKPASPMHPVPDEVKPLEAIVESCIEDHHDNQRQDLLSRCADKVREPPLSSDMEKTQLKFLAEPGVPTKSPSVKQLTQMVEKQLAPRSEEHKDRGNQTFTKHILYYLKFIESKLAAIQQQKEHSTRPQFHEDYPKLPVIGNVSKSPAVQSERSSGVSVSEQSSDKVHENLKRFFTHENETGTSESQNLMDSVQNIINSISKLSYDNTNNDVPEMDYTIDKEAIPRNEPDNKVCVNTASQANQVKEKVIYKYAQAHALSSQLVMQNRGSHCTGGNTVDVHDQTIIPMSFEKEQKNKPQKCMKEFLTSYRPYGTGVSASFQKTFPDSPKTCTSEMLNQCPTITGPEAACTDASGSTERSDDFQFRRLSESDSLGSSSRDLTSSSLASAVLCTSSCESVPECEEAVSVTRARVRETFHTIDQTLQHLATLMGRSPQLPPEF